MVDISILVLQQAVPASIADAEYVFASVNDMLVRQGKEPLFRVTLVGLSEEVSQQKGRFFIKPDTTTAGVRYTDLVIIPALLAMQWAELTSTGSMLPGSRPNINRAQPSPAYAPGLFYWPIPAYSVTGNALPIGPMPTNSGIIIRM